MSHAIHNRQRTLPLRGFMPFIALGALFAPALHGQIDSTINTVTESFRYNSLDLADSWELGNIPFYGNNPPRLTAAFTDPAGDGWLRLTENLGNQSGYIRYKGDPIRAEGLTIYAAFDFMHWDSGGGNDGRTKSADGTTFFIYDADRVDTFNVGAYGGSLGYAQRNETNSADANQAPYNLTVVGIGSSRAELHWRDDSALETEFRIFRRLGTSGSFTQIAANPNNSVIYVDNTVEPGNTYQYYVEAYNGTASTSYGTSSTVQVDIDDRAVGVSGSSVVITARGTTGNEIIQLFIDGTMEQQWTLTTSMATYSYQHDGPIWLDQVLVNYPNDEQGSWDVQVDKITLDGADYEAEDCQTNTGVWQDQCGGSYSEWLHCTGHIDFSTHDALTSGCVAYVEEGGTVWMECEAGDFSASTVWAQAGSNNNVYMSPSGDSFTTPTDSDVDRFMTFPVYINNGGNTFRFYARERGGSNNSRSDMSFYWRVDGGSWNTYYDTSDRASFLWREFGSINLAEGCHTLQIASRSRWARLDKIYITMDAGPSGNPPSIPSVRTDTNTVPEPNPTSAIAAPPTNLTATVAGDTQVNLSWTHPGGAVDQYVVEMAVGPDDLWVPVATVSGATTTYQHTGLSAGVIYRYRARSVIGGLETEASSSVLAQTTGTAGTIVTIRAAGTVGGERLELQVDEAMVTYYTLTTTLKDYVYSSPTTFNKDHIRVRFTNNTGDALVDRITVNNTVYEAELCTTNTGGPRPDVSGVQSASFTEWIINSGYIDFASVKTFAPQDVLGGLTGGYIGIGLDDWGNYSNPNEGRQGGPGFRANAVAVRGDETSDYYYLVGTGDASIRPLPYEMDFPAQTTRPAFSSSYDRRRMSLIITPDNQLTVFLQYGIGDMEALFTADLSSQIRPENILFGFVAATGGTYANHEIRDVVVTTFSSLIWDNEYGDSQWHTGMNWLVDQTPEIAGYEDVLFESAIRRARGGPDLLVDGQEDVTLSGTDVTIRTVTMSAIDFTYRLYNGTLVFASSSGSEGLSINSTGSPNNSIGHIVDASILATNEFNINATEGAKLTVNGNLDNGGNLVRLTGLGTINCNNVISGEGGMRIEDKGTFRLGGEENNTFSGVVIMEEGELRLNKRDLDNTEQQERDTYRSATGLGPVIIGAINLTTNVNTRRIGFVYLDNHNQIDNNADVNLDGGELHLNGKSEW